MKRTIRTLALAGVALTGAFVLTGVAGPGADVSAGTGADTRPAAACACLTGDTYHDVLSTDLG